MAIYPPALQKLIPPGSNDPKITARVVVLHEAVSEADSLYDWFNGPSGGVESHFYVRYDGTVEQYRDTDWQADANLAANDFGISIESEGLGANVADGDSINEGEWSPAQLAAIKALILWCNATHGVPLQECMTWDGAGIGYHNKFIEWGNTECPGPLRIQQFRDVIVPWLATGGKDTMPTFTDPVPLAGAAATKFGASMPWNQILGYVLMDWSEAKTRDKATADAIAGLASSVAALTATVDALAAQPAPSLDLTPVMDKLAAVEADIEALQTKPAPAYSLTLAPSV